jgi:RHS repeat-associated protein
MVAFAENKILTGGGGYNADAETQNYYVRNRYYLPTLGRWLTRDPIGYRPGLNLYEYVYDNPSRYLDPKGLQSLGIALEEAIAAGDVAEVETILDAAEGVLSESREAAARDFLAQVAECETIYAEYDAMGKTCRKCTSCMSMAEIIRNAQCFAFEIAGREAYLDAECDYVLAGSIARGSASAESGHIKELAEKTAAMLKCTDKI